MQCNAKSKRSGLQCKRAAVVGGTKCHMHGGASLGGMASPTFKTGRHSKFLPERLAARYAEAQADPRLLELRDEVALIDIRLGELVERIDAAESAQRWQGLQAAYADLTLATTRSDTAAFKLAMAALGAAMQDGGQDYAIWGEIVALAEQRRKLVDSEAKRLQTMHQMITTERAMVLLAAVTDAIRKHVQDRETLSLISHEIRQLVTVEAQPHA